MEELYNGIRLPDVWPPRDMDDMSLSELPVPYLENRPDVAQIDVGRQLFVDDFLIEENWLEKRFHQAVLDETPVLAPETPMEWNKGVNRSVKESIGTPGDSTSPIPFIIGISVSDSIACRICSITSHPPMRANT